MRRRRCGGVAATVAAPCERNGGGDTEAGDDRRKVRPGASEARAEPHCRARFSPSLAHRLVDLPLCAAMIAQAMATALRNTHPCRAISTGHSGPLSPYWLQRHRVVAVRHSWVTPSHTPARAPTSEGECCARAPRAGVRIRHSVVACRMSRPGLDGMTPNRQLCTISRP